MRAPRQKRLTIRLGDEERMAAFIALKDRAQSLKTAIEKAATPGMKAALQRSLAITKSAQLRVGGALGISDPEAIV